MREIYERVLADREARGVSNDVPVEDILAVVERRGSEEHRAAILNRLLATPDGRRELDLVRAAVQASRPSRAIPFRIPLAIAATLAVALLGRAVLRDEPVGDIRSDPSATTISLLVPSEDLVLSDSTRFTWTRVPAATSYQPELIDESGLVVWTQTTPDTSLSLPSNITLTPGRTYRWRVVARTEAGEISSASRLLRIR